MYYELSDNQPDPAFNEIDQATPSVMNFCKLLLLALSSPVAQFNGRLGEFTLKFELLGEVADELMTPISDYDDVFMPNASHTRPIDARFDRKHLTGSKRRRRKSGFLVNFKTKPVTGPVKEPAPATVFNGRRIATLRKEGFYFLMNPFALKTWPERLQDALLPNKAGLPDVSLCITGPSANYGAREVPKIASARVAWEDVQDD